MFLNETFSFGPATDSCHSVQQELFQKSQYFHDENHDERLQRRRRRDCDQRTAKSSGFGRVSYRERGIYHAASISISISMCPLSNFSSIAYSVVVLCAVLCYVMF